MLAHEYMGVLVYYQPVVNLRLHFRVIATHRLAFSAFHPEKDGKFTPVHSWRGSNRVKMQMSPSSRGRGHRPIGHFVTLAVLFLSRLTSAP